MKDANLLERDRSVSEHATNTQILATKMFFKVYGDLFSPIFKELCSSLKEQLRTLPSQFTISRVQSAYNESESRAYLRPKIWNVGTK